MTPIDFSKFEQFRASGHLPSPKGPALAVVRLTQKDDVALAELAHAVSADPVLVGKLIKAANGAMAAGRRPVASVNDALSALGIAAVRNLALSFSLITSYAQGACRHFDYPGFWSRSLMSGLALQAVVRKVRLLAPEEAFCLGLLAGVGSLGLASVFPERYAEMLADGPADEVLREAERDAFAMTRDDLSVAMLLDWGLPKGVIEPIQFLGAPETASYERGTRAWMLVQAYGFARTLALFCCAPEAVRHGFLPRLLLAGSQLGFEAELVSELSDRVVAEWREWGPLLEIQTQALPSFDEMARPPMTATQSSDSELTCERGDDPPLRILVVDDERAMRALLGSLLRKAGHEVLEASDGAQALELALEHRPQLLITDWMMPGMSGVDLTRALRETLVGRNIYVIIVTARDEDDALVEAFSAGADDFITKPLRPKVLAARLRAGQRVIKLQEEVERDREEIRRFAAELAVTNSKLQQVALTDFLTGFPNRRYAMSRLQQEWSASARSGHSLSCMVIDVDQFKKINDAYGHDAGDAVLKAVAAGIRQAIRAEDVICRIGGDEFMVICPNSDLSSAVQIGERLREAIASLDIAAGSSRLQVSLSVGIAQRDTAMADVEALIKRADEGTYMAKARGRNRVVAVQARGV